MLALARVTTRAYGSPDARYRDAIRGRLLFWARFEPCYHGSTARFRGYRLRRYAASKPLSLRDTRLLHEPGKGNQRTARGKREARNPG